MLLPTVGRVVAVLVVVLLLVVVVVQQALELEQMAVMLAQGLEQVQHRTPVLGVVAVAASEMAAAVVPEGTEALGILRSSGLRHSRNLTVA